MAASQWNKAGTWEEKDVSTWAKETIRGGLASVSTPSAKVSSVESVDGHVQVLHVRGKARVGMELTIKLSWTAMVDANEISGRLTIQELSETDVDDFEMELSDISGSNKDRAPAKKHANTLREGVTDVFQTMMKAAIERAEQRS